MRRARLAAAVCFLTRIPAGGGRIFDAEDVGRSAGLFPVVGALVGAIGGLAMALASLAWPHAPWVVAALGTAATVAITGALHQDALADMADGFGGGRTRSDVLRIMRDSLIGSYGAVALVLALGLRVSALAVLVVEGQALPWLVTAAACGRWASTSTGMALPYARRDEGGLGRAITDYVGPREALVATGITAALALALLGWAGALAMAVAAALALAMGRLVWRRLGGVTGDTLGAVTEVCEVAVLLVGAGWGR